jgi:uncharacterized protein
MAEQVRIFFATDIHGSERCFRKFLNAAAFYKADALIMGGDITGKMLVPVVAEGNGRYVVELFGRVRRFGDDEAPGVRKLIGDAGYYAYETTPDELADLQADGSKVETAFRRVMTETLTRWMDLAAERLAGSPTICLMSPGNDDHPFIGDILRDAERVIDPEEQVIELPGGFELVSFGYSNVTPWHSPRELSEADLGARIDRAASAAAHPDRTIFNLHVPPIDSSLDDAVLLTADLSPVMRNGSPVIAGVGSTAVRAAIERFQPLVSLHGHIHESRGMVKIGRTAAYNPGSEYSEGVLRGLLLTLEPGKGVRSHQFVAG